MARWATSREIAPRFPAGNQGSQATHALRLEVGGKVIEVVAAADLPAAEEGSLVSSSSSTRPLLTPLALLLLLWTRLPSSAAGRSAAAATSITFPTLTSRSARVTWLP